MIKKPEGPFNIIINEYQRTMIKRALYLLTVTQHDQLCEESADPSGINCNAWQDAVELNRMLTELPSTNEVVDALGNTVTHGLCL